MIRTFLPFILALFGLPVILFSSSRPILEWQISEIVTDFPSSYKIHSFPSPWEARIGDSLEDKSYIFRRIYVSENDKACSTSNLNMVVKRSRNDELLERLSLARPLNDVSINWVIGWILIEIALSVAYILWFTFWHEHRTASNAIISAGFATMCFCYLFIPMMKLMGPRISFGGIGIANCHGTIMFSAKLLKVYYSIPILWFAGIFAELAAFAMMVYQVAKAVSKRRESSKLAMG